jgi:hypothetical protein
MGAESKNPDIASLSMQFQGVLPTLSAFHSVVCFLTFLEGDDMKALLLLLLLPLSGCVSQAKYDESQKQVSSLTKQLKEMTDNTMEANSKWAECRAHKYQLVPSGMRTWRFDTVTGKSCVQLTTAADWKSKNTKAESCACEDLLQEPNANPKRVERICGF